MLVMRIFLVSLFLSHLFLTDCQNDGPLSTQSRIARSWQNETSTVVSMTTGKSVVTYNRLTSAYKAWMNLAPDGAYTSYLDNDVTTGTWQLVDNQLKITVPNSSIPVYEVENVSAKNLTLLSVVPANPQDRNQQGFLSLLQWGYGVDISQGVRLTIEYSAR
jgi:hypothetical protein